MAVTIDLGENNIHPANKQEVGRRLGLLARANVYGEDIAASGPVFSSAKFDGGRAVIDFKQLDGGLGLIEKGGDTLRGSKSPAPTGNSSGPTQRSKGTKWFFPPTRCRTPSPCVTPGATIPTVNCAAKGDCPRPRSEPTTGSASLTANPLRRSASTKKRRSPKAASQVFDRLIDPMD